MPVQLASYSPLRQDIGMPVKPCYSCYSYYSYLSVRVQFPFGYFPNESEYACHRDNKTKDKQLPAQDLAPLDKHPDDHMDVVIHTHRAENSGT